MPSPARASCASAAAEQPGVSRRRRPFSFERTRDSGIEQHPPRRPPSPAKGPGAPRRGPSTVLGSGASGRTAVDGSETTLGGSAVATVSDFIVERLSEWGVTRVYGYPGDGINGVMGALNRAEGRIEFVQARHEEMAAFMAC